jgi:hypothetical protein
MISRVTGWILLVAAVAAMSVHFGRGTSIAEEWARIDANSLVGLQALVEKRLDPNPDDPTIYFDYVLPALELPFWLSLAVLLVALSGIGFLRRALGERRRQRGGRFG